MNIIFPFVLFSDVLYPSLESFWLPERGLKSKLTEYSLVWAKSQVGGCDYQLSCFITCNKCYSLTLCVSCCRHFSCVIINHINHRPVITMATTQPRQLPFIRKTRLWCTWVLVHSVWSTSACVRKSVRKPLTHISILISLPIAGCSPLSQFSLRHLHRRTSTALHYNTLPR